MWLASIGDTGEDLQICAAFFANAPIATPLCVQQMERCSVKNGCSCGIVDPLCVFSLPVSHWSL